MDPWQKETLGLKVGGFIIWQDEAIEAEGKRDSSKKVDGVETRVIVDQCVVFALVA